MFLIASEKAFAYFDNSSDFTKVKLNWDSTEWIIIPLLFAKHYLTFAKNVQKKTTTKNKKQNKTTTTKIKTNKNKNDLAMNLACAFHVQKLKGSWWLSFKIQFRFQHNQMDYIKAIWCFKALSIGNNNK